MPLDLIRYTADCATCVHYRRTMTAEALGLDAGVVVLIHEAFAQGHHLEELQRMPAREVAL